MSQNFLQSCGIGAALPLRIARAIATVIGLWLLAGVALAAGSLENPQSGSAQTGIGLVSGWACPASQVAIVIDGSAPIAAAYGTSRGDTARICGHANTGFGLLLNFNLFAPGSHTIVALADGAPIGSATFGTVTLGQEFLRDASSSATIPGFPNASREVTLQWQESRQNFAIVGAGPVGASTKLDGTYQLARTSVAYLNGTELDTADGSVVATGTMVIAGSQVSQSIRITVSGTTIPIYLVATFVDYGPYIIVTQDGVTERVSVVGRNPVLITHAAGPAQGTTPGFAEVDQWVRASSAANAVTEKEDTRRQSAPASSLGRAVGAVLPASNPR